MGWSIGGNIGSNIGSNMGGLDLGGDARRPVRKAVDNNGAAVAGRRSFALMARQ
jgi:hypothetical protein